MSQTAPVTIRTGQTQATLHNGMLAVAEQTPPGLPTAVCVVYPAGSRDDPQPHAGLAHLVEHLMFAKAGRAATHAQIVEGAKGRCFARTALDHTSYTNIIEPSALKAVLASEANRLTSLPASQADLSNQINVVLAEYDELVSSKPHGAFPSLLAPATLFADWPNSHNTYGDDDTLNHIDLHTVEAWHHRHYGPAHAAIVVSGPAPAAQTLDAVADAFTAIPRQPAQPPTPARSHALAPRQRCRTDAWASDVAIAVTWPIPDIATSQQRLALELVAMQLPSRITQMHSAQALVGVRGEAHETCAPAGFILLGTGDDLNPKAITEEAHQTLANLATLEETDLLRAKQAWLTRRRMIDDDPAARVERVATAAALWKDADRHAALPGILEEIDVDMCRSEANKLAAYPPGLAISHPTRSRVCLGTGHHDHH